MRRIDKVRHSDITHCGAGSSKFLKQFRNSQRKNAQNLLKKSNVGTGAEVSEEDSQSSE